MRFNNQKVKMVKNEKEKKYKVTFYIPRYCSPMDSSKRSVECNQMDMIKYVSRQELDERYVLKVEEIKQ